jgi:hypothetical protein
MDRFVLGQKWCARGTLDGDLFAEVVQVFDQGRLGILIISDDKGNVIDTFEGTADEFRSTGEWKPIQ